ncbi:MAG: MoxR family ATPase [Kofleriaceae bacterium]|nr:MoxR family ATPase [Kofleriaceae bacterium]MCL4227573.1 MoxR family ATPase [Myxococcales bacterium]
MSPAAAASPAEIETNVAAFTGDLRRLRQEIATMIVGQDAIVEGVLMCMLGGGHALLEGVPGLGKTMLVRTMAECMHASFSRIQFTPDLMPADIVGTNVIVEEPGGGKRFEFQRGPIFANIVLADEINRATPKTQSALLEAMSEGSVTVAKSTHTLEKPFFVLATQNPLEMEGTYPLPEAQLDRFFFKLVVEFPNRDDLHTILDRTTAEDVPRPQAVMEKARVLELRDLVRKVPLARSIQDYAVRVLQATHPETPEAPPTSKKYLRYGASPRGLQAIILAAKIRALLEGRYAVAIDDIRAVAAPALRHRLILNFEGEAEGVRPDAIIAEILSSTPETR